MGRRTVTQGVNLGPLTIVFGVTTRASLDFVVPIVNELSQKGNVVHLVFSPSGNSRLPVNATVSQHQVVMSREINYIQDIVSFIRISFLVLSLSPHAVVFGTPKASLLGITAAWILRVPTRVFVVHGLRSEGLPGVKSWFMRAIERLCSALSTHTICVSQSAMLLGVQTKVLNPKVTLVVGEGSAVGVDLVENSNRVPTAQKPPVIGFLGRIAEGKGLDVLLDAIALVSKIRPECKVEIVGNVEEPRILERIRLSPNATWYPWTHDISFFLRKWSALCLPSEREGMPTVVLEAASHGLPVIATECTGTIDLIKDGISGRLVQVGSSRKLAAAIVSHLDNPGFADEMATTALETSARHFDRRKVSKDQAIFLEMISSSGFEGRRG